MKKTYWLYLIAAVITIIGLVTGKFLFLLFVFPLGLFGFGKKNDSE